MCRIKNEAVSNIATKCKMLAQKKYKKRHDHTRRYIHWRICEKSGFELEIQNT